MKKQGVPMIERRAFLKYASLSAALVASGGALAGCGSREDATSASDSELAQANENEPKVLTTAVDAELTTLYPLNMDQQNYIATKLCYEGLVNYVDGEVVPCLAESWEYTEDGKALTFHLREGITFHDGNVLNAEAVKTLYDYQMPNENFSGIAAVANLKSIEVNDEYSLTFRYDAPYFAYLTDFCYPEVMIVVSPDVLEEGNYQTMKDVVGTGPYMYEELVDGEYVRFIRNEDYWGDQPYYDEVIVKYIPESSSRLQALQNGEIDLIYGSSLVSWDEYEQAISMDGVTGGVAQIDSETRNLVLNASNPCLGDLRVREAIAYAIDKAAIAEGLTYGHEAIAESLFPEAIPYADVELDTQRSFDSSKAQELLDEAGWELNEATGIREKDGQALSLLFTYDSGESMNKSIATTIKSQLSTVGIDVETEGQDMMTWWKQGLAGEYGITIWDTEQPYTAPHNFFIPMINRSPHVPALSAIDGSEEFVSEIERFMTIDDEEEVANIFEYLLNFDNENVLDLPLLYMKDMVVYREEVVAGYQFSSTPMFFDVREVEPA